MRPEPAIDALRAQIERGRARDRHPAGLRQRLAFDCTLEPVADDGHFAVRLGLRMVRGLANVHASTIVATRADQAFASVDDLWRRAGVPQAALVQLAEADAFRPALGLARREALWAIKALRDEPLPLFAAASAREAEMIPEINEPAVALPPMTAGGEVVEDYRHIGLTLRSHPISFLREDLRRRRIVSCAEAMEARDGRWLEAAGIVLVRQRPGSAKGVMFITLEDETGIANLVVWPQVFEQHRRTVLSAGMIAVSGRIQREGEVVHLVARKISDLSAELASIGEREGSFPLPHARGAMAARDPIRASCCPRGCAAATSTYPTSTSTTSRSRRGISGETSNFLSGSGSQVLPKRYRSNVVTAQLWNRGDDNGGQQIEARRRRPSAGLRR